MCPHLVPVTFAVEGNRVVIGIDQKPKSTTSLRRLRNIEENPQVAVLSDHYDDDWTRLWWVRVDGQARIAREGAVRDVAVGMLMAKYQQYADDPPRGPAIVIDVERWSGWTFSASATHKRI
jgi:PPOX class probable F420-dependent enzyme